jgi:hypothetical protein
MCAMSKTAHALTAQFRAGNGMAAIVRGTTTMMTIITTRKRGGSG